MNASINTMNVDEWAMRYARASVQQWDDGDACDRPAPELIDFGGGTDPDMGRRAAQFRGWGVGDRGEEGAPRPRDECPRRPGTDASTSREALGMDRVRTSRGGWRGHVRGRALAKSRRQSKRADSLTRKARR